MPITKNGKYVVDEADQFTLNKLLVNSDTANGIQLKNGDATYPWRDIIGTISESTSNPVKPDLSPFKDNISAWHFGTGEKAYVTFHMPHDYRLGSDLYLHIHWGHNGTSISGTNAVIARYMYAPRTYTPTTAFGTEGTQTISVSGLDITNYPQYCHSVDEVQISQSGGGGGMLDTDSIEVDGLILVLIEQSTIPTIGGGTETEPFIFKADIHYQSTNIGTKSSAPDYYI